MCQFWNRAVTAMSWALLNAAGRAHHGGRESIGNACSRKTQGRRKAFTKELASIPPNADSVEVLTHQEDKNVDASAHDGTYKGSPMPNLVAINMRSINRIQTITPQL